uniref:Uncharacterized protein n=1 Tax=Aegilops tauschii subsp. strangulata TaxID=200361 RepID=A0A453HWV1_AEGTS
CVHRGECMRVYMALVFVLMLKKGEMDRRLRRAGRHRGSRRPRARVHGGAHGPPPLPPRLQRVLRPSRGPRPGGRRQPRPRRLPPRPDVPCRARGQQGSLGRHRRSGGERDGRGEESPSDHAAGGRGQIAQSIYLVSC